jgi:hypothetical protein
MRGQIGYWGSRTSGGMCVGFGEEMLSWLDCMQTGRKVFVSVSKERQVIVIPDSSGGHVSCAGPSNGSPFRYVSSVTPDSLFLDIDIPPFELYEVQFKLENGCLSTPLDQDHELPWPKLRLDCTTYEAEQLAVEALQWRLNSLVATGQTTFKSGKEMPDRLRRLIPKGCWAECMATAKTLAGVN